MSRFIKQVFIGLSGFSESLASIFNASSHTKSISLNNQQCMIQTTLINLYLNEHTQGLRYYAFAVNLDRCTGSCNTLNDLSNKVCVSNKTEALNVNVFNIITGINESKTLTKHMSCESRCECKDLKEHHVREKSYCWNPTICTCKNGEYLARTIDNSVITHDKVINAEDSVSTNVSKNVTSTASIHFRNKKVRYKMD